MNPIIIPVCLAFCIAGLLVDLIAIVLKFVILIAKAITEEPCKVKFINNLIFAFIFSFVIALFFLM